MSSYVTDVDLFDITSSISTPFYLLSLTGKEQISGQFVYNYYTRDEGVSETVTLGAVDAQSDQYDFIVENWENGVYPRQINLSFSVRSKYLPTTLDKGVLTTAAQNEQVIFEDAPFSTKFSSVLAHDTSVDEKIYAAFEGVDDAEIPERTKGFLNVSRFQSQGYRFSKAQAREEIVDLYESDTKTLNLAISLNSLFVADVLRTTTRWQASAFSDEFAFPIEEAQTIQDSARSNSSNPFQISEDEIDVSLKVIETKYVRSSVLFGSAEESSVYETYRTSRIGYIIEKYGEQVDGSTLRHDDIIIEDPNETAFTDSQVRYGGVYNYRIRTVYRTYIISPRESGSEFFDGYDIATIFVATKGTYTTVQCTENIPPLPPNNISFQQTLRGLYIRWNFPINTQKDIKRFQVFRRKSIEDPFSLITEINFDQTILPYTTGENIPKEKIEKSVGPVKHYIDREFSDISSDFIYSICSIDAHGLSSAYSDQFRVRFDKITGKLLISRVSTEGAPKPYPNVNVEADFFSDLITDSGHSRIRVYFDPEYSDVTRKRKSLSLISKDEIGVANYKISLTEINLAKSQIFDIFVGKSGVNSDGIPISLARFYTAD